MSTFWTYAILHNILWELVVVLYNFDNANIPFTCSVNEYYNSGTHT